MKTTKKYIKQKWLLTIKILPLVILVAIIKFVFHHYGLEVMELNALFTSLVAGTIFLLGFLLSGVLSDYKESEKIPSELSATIKSLFDDGYTIYKSKNSDTAYKLMEFLKSFMNCLTDWFFKKERTQLILQKIDTINDYFAELDNEGIQPNYIIKMKGEQSSMRKMILRIDTIRDTGFISSAYAIVETMSFLIALGLILIKIEPFYASLFFTILVTFLIAYMILLIKDIDNPFDYSVSGESGTEISLKPIHDLEFALKEFK
jgi:hypothetical protein